jgi:hypothetical protein
VASASLPKPRLPKPRLPKPRLLEPSLPEKVVAIDKALTRAKVPHAFGGALALAYYAEPRSTVDVDLNVFVTTDLAPRVSRTLERLGVDTAPLERPATARDGQVRCRWGRTPIDVFFSYDAMHDAMRDAVARVPFGPDRIPILAPEHLVVCKAVFDRSKDWLDIQQVLVTVTGFDAGEARRWLEHLVGVKDARYRKLERQMSALLAP